ncbi:neurofilament medium polypeptide-like [Harpegnathos saltator]|uniref:neurofilament medium polypeptide-like n=1 Tax=Harpegnathos saltator TaxID=610380 RepID=UPI00059092CB|nr:neurofilament medium polypeptide-like [Harpegnathos saltator]
MKVDREEEEANASLMAQEAVADTSLVTQGEENTGHIVLRGEEEETTEKEGCSCIAKEKEAGGESGNPPNTNNAGKGESTAQAETKEQLDCAVPSTAQMEVEEVVEGSSTASAALPPRKRKKEESTSPGEEKREGHRSEEEEIRPGPMSRKMKVTARPQIISDESDLEMIEPKRTTRAGKVALPSTSGKANYRKQSESETVSTTSDEDYVPKSRATKKDKATAPRKKRKVEAKGKKKREQESIRERDKGGKYIATTKKETQGRIQEKAKEGSVSADNKEAKILKSQTQMKVDNREESMTLGPARYIKMTAAEAGALAMEWLDEVESGRAKSSNIQGRISGMMRTNVIKVKDLIRALIGKAEATGDPLYLRMRNAELSMQIK